jgi:ankyrin repeat protein
MKNIFDIMGSFLKDKNNNDDANICYLNAVLYASNGKLSELENIIVTHNKTGVFNIEYNENEIFRSACKYGRKNVVAWLLENYNINVCSKKYAAIKNICRYGHLDTLNYIMECGKKINYNYNDDEFFQIACDNGKIGIVKLLLSKINSIDIHCCYEYPFISACSGGYLDLVKLLHDYSIKNDTPIDISVMNYGAAIECCKNNQLHVLKWLIDNYEISLSEKKKEIFIAEALFNGNIDICKFIYKNYRIDLCVSENYIFLTCCRIGNIDAIKWYLEKIILKFKALCDGFTEACISNNILLSKYLYKQMCITKGCADNINLYVNDTLIHCTMIKTMSEKQFEMIKWIMSLSTCDPRIADDIVFFNACKFDNIALVKYYWQKYKNIKYDIDNHKLFLELCELNNINVALFLTTIERKYLITIENGKIINRYILKQLSASD